MKATGFLLFFLGAVFTSAAAGDSKPVALADTPPAVQKTIAAQVGDGKLGEIFPGSESNERTFDVGFTAKSGEEHSLTVADDGTALSTVVKIGDTPAAVQSTIKGQSAGWELGEISRNLDDTEESYDVQVVKGPRSRTFTVAGNGDLLSQEVELADTPVPVQAAIRSRAGDGGAITSIDEDFGSDGKTFDAVVTGKDGASKSFSVREDGALLSEEVTLDEVPEPARKTIKEKIGSGRILRIDKSLLDKVGSIFPYEVEGRKDGKPFDFSVGPKGKFLGIDD